MESLISWKTSFAVISLLALCWYISFLYKRRRLYKLAEQFNGPRPYPIIGDIPRCLIPLSEIPDAILRGIRYYKSPQRLWFGPLFAVHIFDPENLKILLNSPHALAKEPWFYKIIELATGRGIDTVPVEEWKRRRKIIALSFNQKSIDGFFDTFVFHSNKLAASLEEIVGAGVCDVEDHIVSFALRIVMDSLLGSSKATNDEIRTIADCVNQLFAATTKRITNPLYFFEPVFKMTPYGRHIMKVKKKLDAHIDCVLNRWKEDTLSKVKSEALSNQKESRKLVECLLASTDGTGKLTAEELRGDVNTLMIGGTETTPATIGFALILLGMHPEIQEKVYEEVAMVMGSKKQLELDDLKNLEYLERAIKEVMRLFPAATGVGRYTEKEIQLTNQTIPVNTSVIIGLLALHRNPDLWPNPHKFDPDRFLPEEEAKRHPYSFLPFSGGPRNCIGPRFAWMSLKVVLAILVMRFKITTDYKCVEDIRLESAVKMPPIDGFRIAITVR